MDDYAILFHFDSVIYISHFQWWTKYIKVEIILLNMTPVKVISTHFLFEKYKI